MAILDRFVATIGPCERGQHPSLGIIPPRSYVLIHAPDETTARLGARSLLGQRYFSGFWDATEWDEAVRRQDARGAEPYAVALMVTYEHRMYESGDF